MDDPDKPSPLLAADATLGTAPTAPAAIMPTSPAAMRAVLLRRHQAEVSAAAERADRLRASAVDLARLLRTRFGVDEVWLFGSLAWGAPDAHADIDLAVTGLASQDYFPALATLLAVAPAPVDLVRLEEAPPALRERVLRHGRRLDDAA